jgi:DNA-binding MarR family transcriptional regulator
VAGPARRMLRAWCELRRVAARDIATALIVGTPGDPDHVDPPQLDILEQLVEHDGQRMSDLAAALHVDPSTITRTMHRMEAAGLARREMLAADGRVVTARITDEGRRRYAVAARRWADLVESVLDDVAPDDRGRLIDLLERVAGVMTGRARGTDPSPMAAG